MDMDDEAYEQAILNNRLGERGAQGGRLGASISSQLGLGGPQDLLGEKVGGDIAARSGRRGTERAFRFLRNDVHEIDLQMKLAPLEAEAFIRQLLGTLGELVDGASSEGTYRLRAVIGAGGLNLNPAVVTVTIDKSASSTTRVHLRGIAKEGLIKQHAGRKSVDRVATGLVGR